MARSVGLDIHPRGVRAVEVTGGRKSFRIAKYMEHSLTPRGGAPDPEELREALTDIFKNGKFSRHSVVTAVEAHETVVREIPVPFKADDQIRKVVKYEAEHHLHDCDADDVIVQYTKVGESAEGTNLLVFAALIFGFADAVQGKMQAFKIALPPEFLQTAPYVMTIIVVAGLVGRVRPPAQEGKPYEKQ